jgi:S-DNA-T family DNA segregation ATPase FtsK/SpoIIIE
VTGATRYTTSPEPVVTLLGLAFQPGTAIAFVAVVVGMAAQLPGQILGVTAAALWLVATLAWLWHQHFTPAATLTRAMADHGLVHRRADGVIHTPARKGRARRIGDNRVLRWSLPPGVTLRDVQDRAEALEHQCSVGLRFWFAEGFLHGELLGHAIPDRVDFETFYKGPRPAGRLLVGLGRGKRGALWADLASLPHLLVGGQTGFGKSVFLRQLLTHLVLTNPPDRLHLTCVDLKGGVELHRFAKLPHSTSPVVDNVADAADALGKVRVTLDERLGQLRAAGHSDTDAWQAAGLPQWPRLLVVVDEVAELTARSLDKDGRSARDEATGRLCEIARLGRAAGVHLIVCTQRPDADAVPGQLKANLSGTVAFRVRNAVNSRILLDNDRATMLAPFAGRGLWSHDGLEEFQAVYLDAEESARLLDERWGSHDGPLGTWPPPVAKTAGDAAPNGADVDVVGHLAVEDWS